MSRIVDLSLDIYDRAPTFWPDPKTVVIEHLKIANLKNCRYLRQSAIDL